MKTTRILLGLWLAAALTACSLFPNFPTLPPGWTVTPSQTFTPAPTLTPTITPTPMPQARVGVADHELFNGDYDNALIHYQSAYQDSPDALIRAAAKWGEARVYFASEKYEDAVSATQALITEFPSTTYLGQAYFLQGYSQYRLGNYQAAADAWQTYLSLRPGYLDSRTQELRGDALFLLGSYAEALPAYKAAIQAPHLGDAALLDMKVASTYSELGDVTSAIALYDGVAARATSDYIKAQAAYETGLVYQANGQTEEALGKFRLAVEDYPLSYYAYLSLVELLNAGAEVSDLDRGLVDFFAGQYDVAIAAFTRYNASTPVQDGTAYYFLAQSYRDIGDYNSAIATYETFIANYPTNSRWGDAWGEKAFIEWYNNGAFSIAAETLLDFVQQVPNTDLSVEYLMSAARIYERSEQYDKALETWARVANEYPGTEDASTAVFLMGVIYYRQKDYVAALDAFNRSLSLSQPANDQARAYLWIGKTQKQLGKNEETLAAWREAQTKDPAGYYSERARDLLNEREPFEPSETINLNQDLARLRTDADAWIRLTFNLESGTDLNGLGPLTTDSRVIRGTELWQMGLYEDAREEFENLRDEIDTDPVATYRLTNYLVDLGLYRSAIFAARQTLTLAGLDEHTESMMAPPYFGYIRYGLYYSDLVLPNAQENGLDPLFLFSVIRQESLFEGFVNSNAGARGLMQIVPSTGAQIVSQVGWPVNYTEDDLYRPIVNVKFGSHYLATNLSYLNDDLYATLAAYNGGPGNASTWQELAGNDPDLYLESVRFEETRNYIRNIYEIYVIYKRLYGTGP
ncbi:MAG: tetratricopeptide repeat protein [Anaerolineales bacterium]|nr:tetratricopeptide repeat protein [Anaerolineales bacterium]